MSSSPVASIGVAPVATTAAALRAEILGAAEGELIAILGEPPAIDPTAPHGATTAGAAPANPLTQAVDTARTAAAVQQGSLAPLFADLAETLSLPNLPAPIRAAVAQVLALQLPANGPIVPQDVRQAVAQSGLFLEADLASPGAPAPLDLKTALLTLQRTLPAPPPAPETPAEPVSPAPQPAQAAAPSPQGPALQTPALQTPAPPTPAPQSPAPLGAPQPTLFETPQPQAPPPNAAPTSAAPTPVPTTPASAPVATAPASQSAPLQTPNAEPAPPPIAPQAAAPLPQANLIAPQPAATATLDPKAALLALQVLPAAPDDEPPAEPALQDLKAALQALRQAAGGPSPVDTPSPAGRTPPPARDAALSPQAPAPATLPERADLAELADHLRPQVDEALARLTLHQLASLPDGASSAWMFELPVATPQGTAMAQFEVERDGAGSGGADGATPWRARFSIDIEPLGPVHVHVAMNGGQAAVSVWAERADSLAWLRDQGGELAAALPAEVVFRQGAPRGEAPASGHFLDQTS